MIRSTGRPVACAQAVGVQPGLELVAAEPLARLCAGRDVVGLPVDDLQAGERRDHEVDEPLHHDPVARERERHLPQRARRHPRPCAPPRTPGRRATSRSTSLGPVRHRLGHGLGGRDGRDRVVGGVERQALQRRVHRPPDPRAAAAAGPRLVTRPLAACGRPRAAAIAVALVYRTRRAPATRAARAAWCASGVVASAGSTIEVGEGRRGDAARQGGRVPLDGRRGRARVEEAAGPALARVARGVPERHDQVVAGAGGAPRRAGGPPRPAGAAPRGRSAPATSPTPKRASFLPTTTTTSPAGPVETVGGRA